MGITRWYWSAALGGFVALVLLMLGLRWQVISSSYTPAMAAGSAGAQQSKAVAGEHKPEYKAQPAPSSDKANAEQLNDVVPAAKGASSTAKASPGKGTSQPRSKASAAIPRLDLNHASSAELQLLPGIGPVLANRIVSYRNMHGHFTRYDDLDAVKGVGPKMLEKLKPYLYVTQRSL